MPYVDRNQAGNIIGVYANAQREGHEFVETAELWSPVPTHGELVAGVMLGMKSQRMDIFRVLDTLQVDALTSSDQPRALAIMQAKSAMTALNSIDLSAYQTSEQMEQAIWLAYWGIVSQAPQEVQDAFNALVPR